MNGNNRNQLIIRDRNMLMGYSFEQKDKIKNGTSCVNLHASTITKNQMNRGKIVIKNSSLPQIAIKRKNNDSLSSINTEVVLLNGNWDTSNKIPNIVAEMHNVNIEELQSLQSLNPKLIEPSLKSDLGQCVTPSPRSSDSGIETDCTDGNLSWLLNYRIHELPPVPDSGTVDHQTSINQSYTLQNGRINQVYIAETMPKQYFDQHNVQNVNVAKITSDKQLNSGLKEDGTKLHGHTYRYSGPKKPPFTYTELIEHALNEKGELTVSGIYQWISDHFPFYKQNDDRWKNSVRHNLSINPHFRKGSKAVHGAGHLWTIAQREDKKTWNIKKQRMQQFIQTTYNKDYNRDHQLEMELETATASILPENNEVTVADYNSNGSTNQDPKTQNIEIEYVNVIDVTNGLGDFLCPPVPKEQVVEECGLSGDYLITDINPTTLSTLGLNLSDAEIINGGNIYDDLNFQCYEMNNE